MRVDLERAAALRQGTQGSRSTEEIVRRGDSLLVRGLCRRALRRFRQAESMKPDDLQIVGKIASAQLCLRNFAELGDIYARMLRSGEKPVLMCTMTIL